MMKKILKSILSIVLVISMLLCTTVSAFAAEAEEYLCELRLVYAEDYAEAKEILSESEFEDYRILNENLNEDSGEIGVWLAYKTTDDIEDAITDISVMQMNGGYNIGNYEEMIRESYDEYVEMGEIYQEAIDYWVEAYDADDYLANAAYRQLNFYNVISEGIPTDEIPSFEGELVGDILYDGISENELATMFMQGNIHVLNNIRSLLAMGVSYNEDGMHYLQKVAEAAKKMEEDPAAFDYEDNFDDYDDLALLISGTILTVKNMFNELAAYESELNYEDDELTDKEIKYSEYKSFADRFRDVEYLNGESLYDFSVEYTLDDSDLTSLYPLVAALNEGQIAMTRVTHYYDVVRYSMSEYPEDVMDELIAEQEAIYSETPFNVYAGVDRSIYYGSFALTSEAYRADAYTSEGFLGSMFVDQTAWGVSSVLSATGSVALGIWAIRRTIAAKQAADISAQEAAKNFALDKAAAISAAENTKYNLVQSASNVVAPYKADALGSVAMKYGSTYDDVATALVNKYVKSAEFWSQQNFGLKLSSLQSSSGVSMQDAAIIKQMNVDYYQVYNPMNKAANQALADAQNMTQTVTSTSTLSGFTLALYIVGAIMLLYSAFSLGMTIYNYYHPDYEDIPVAMVDLINTVDGDRYIKYDVVFDAETNSDGVYEAADLNAFNGERWNALYYTKSYEAGKPLLADEFSISNRNNKPDDNYAPVHGFGEVVCYDLNKYNFEGDTNIYLSVKQSENDKSAVAEVPEVVGSMFGAGFLFLAGGIGIIAGVGGTLATHGILKKRKKSKTCVDDSELKDNV